MQTEAMFGQHRGGGQNDIAQSIKTNTSGIYLAGYFTGTIYFGPSFSLTDSSTTKADIFVAKLNTAAGIGEKENGMHHYFCFPNPADVEVQLRGFTNNEKYILSDVLGKIILQGTLHGNKISVSNLDPGVYFISITGRDGKVVQKFINE